MTNEDGSLWLTFNGEIYNFREIRRGLEARHRFRSRSDGEVILHLYEEKGDAAVAELDGMFAFALWDARRRRLAARARPRGEEAALLPRRAEGLRVRVGDEGAPRAPGGAARAGPRGPAALPDLRLRADARHVLPRDPGAAAGAPHGGHGGRGRGAEAVLAGAVPSGGRSEPDSTDAEAEERFRALLRAAVERRLVADVPLGAFLSGGLDSSTVVALMAEAAGGRVKTFTIGFAGHSEYDERAHARVVAERFSTEHTEFVVEPKALDLVDRLVWHHDGPFGDSSAVPTYLLSELTRTKVTVALNGDGGDEVFAGYLRLYGGAALRAGAARRVPGARRGCSASCPSPPTASTRCASPSASPRRGACRSWSATCAGTRTSPTTCRGC